MVLIGVTYIYKRLSHYPATTRQITPGDPIFVE